jgi:hypothetical protein
MNPARPFTVAMTGGVASGKSEVEPRFAALGAHVIDADVVARELVEPGGAALDAIVRAFGTDVLDRTGGLDRAAMRRRGASVPTSRPCRRWRRLRHMPMRRPLAGPGSGNLPTRVRCRSMRLVASVPTTSCVRARTERRGSPRYEVCGRPDPVS